VHITDNYPYVMKHGDTEISRPVNDIWTGLIDTSVVTETSTDVPHEIMNAVIHEWNAIRRAGIETRNSWLE
jgi:hypothetical protein